MVMNKEPGGNNEARFPEEFSLCSVFRFYADFHALLPLQPASCEVQCRRSFSGFPPFAAEILPAGWPRAVMPAQCSVASLPQRGQAESSASFSS